MQNLFHQLRWVPHERLWKVCDQKTMLVFSVLTPIEINQDCLRASCWIIYKLLILTIVLAVYRKNKVCHNTYWINYYSFFRKKMVILNTERKLFKMLLFPVALLSQQEWDFSDVTTHMCEPALAPWPGSRSVSVRSRVSVHLNKCQGSEICTGAGALDVRSDTKVCAWDQIFICAKRWQAGSEALPL